MAEDPLHDIIEAVRARLNAEVETQVETASERHRQELARAEAARQEAEQALATERHLAQARLEEERRTAAEQLEKLEQALQVVELQRSTADPIGSHDPAGSHDLAGFSDPTGSNDATGSSAASNSLGSSRLLERFREIDAAASLSEALASIARAAATEAPRWTLFLANGSQLDPWPIGSSTSPAEAVVIDEPAAGLMTDALRRGESVRTDRSCAVPLLLDGTPIGVLHGEADAGAAPAWADELEALARHGATRLGYLAALRTAQARQWIAASSVARPAPSARIEQEDTTASARRYARLVVSEIKLYNESAVEEGRSRRDLLARLGPEIERARRSYEERVPASVAARSEYFQQELVQTLAGGDSSLLG